MARMPTVSHRASVEPRVPLVKSHGLDTSCRMATIKKATSPRTPVAIAKPRQILDLFDSPARRVSKVAIDTLPSQMEIMKSRSVAYMICPFVSARRANDVALNGLPLQEIPLGPGPAQALFVRTHLDWPGWLSRTV